MFRPRKRIIILLQYNSLTIIMHVVCNDEISLDYLHDTETVKNQRW